MKIKLSVFQFAALLCISWVTGYSQCPTNIYTDGQNEVDNFEIDYPDCVNQGWITNINIGNGYDIDTVTNLVGLASINSIRGELDINYIGCDDFTDLINLDSIDQLDLRGASSDLIDLSGLENLEYLRRFTAYAPIASIDEIEHLDVKTLNL